MEFGTLTKEEIDSLFTPVNFGNVTKEEIDSLFNPAKSPQVGVPTSDTTASVKSTPARTYKSSTSKTSQKNNSIPTVSKTELEEKKQTFGRSGYSPNELRDMERAANAQEETKKRISEAATKLGSPILGHSLKNTSEDAQKAIDKLQRRIDRLERNGADTRKIDALKGQIDKIYESDHSDAQKNIDKFVDPEYKMTKYEKKQAKKYFEDYLKNNKKANDLYHASDAATSTVLSTRLTPEEAEEYSKMITLKNKSSGLNSALLHGVESVPGVKSLADKSTKKYADATGADIEQYNLSNQLEQTQKQNPVESFAGNAAYQLGAYTALAPLTGGIPAVSRAAESAKNLFGGGKLGTMAANIVRGQAADAFLNTIPNAVIPDLFDGKNWKEIAKDAAKNQGVNFAFNLGGELIPQAFKALKGQNDIPKLGDDAIEKISQSLEQGTKAETKNLPATLENVDPQSLKVESVKTDEGTKYLITKPDETGLMTENIEPGKTYNSREEVERILNKLKFDLKDIYEKQGVEGLRKATNNLSPLEQGIGAEKQAVETLALPDNSIKADIDDINADMAEEAVQQAAGQPRPRTDIPSAANPEMTPQQIYEEAKKQTEQAFINTVPKEERQAFKQAIQDNGLLRRPDIGGNSDEYWNEILKKADELSKSNDPNSAQSQYVKKELFDLVEDYEVQDKMLKQLKANNFEDDFVMSVGGRGGQHAKALRDRISETNLDDESKQALKEMSPMLDNLIKRAQKAKTKEALNDVIHDAALAYGKIEKILEGSSYVGEYPGRKEEIDAFLNALKGRTIKIPDNIRADFTDMKISDFNKAMSGLGGNVKFSRTNGMGIDQLFDEMNRLSGNRLIGYAEKIGNPDLNTTQLQAIMDYAADLKRMPEFIEEAYNGGMMDDWKDLINAEISNANSRIYGAAGVEDVPVNIYQYQEPRPEGPEAEPGANVFREGREVKRPQNPEEDYLTKFRTHNEGNFGLTDEELNNEYFKTDNENFHFLKGDRKADKQAAINNLDKDFDGTVNKLLNKPTDDIFTPQEVDEGFMAWNKKIEQARETGNYEDAANLMYRMTIDAHDKAQGLQAYGAWKANTPAGVVHDANSFVRDMAEQRFGKAYVDYIDSIVKDVSDLSKDAGNIDTVVSEVEQALKNTGEASNIAENAGAFREVTKADIKPVNLEDFGNEIPELGKAGNNNRIPFDLQFFAAGDPFYDTVEESLEKAGFDDDIVKRVLDDIDDGKITDVNSLRDRLSEIVNEKTVRTLKNIKETAASKGFTHKINGLDQMDELLKTGKSTNPVVIRDILYQANKIPNLDPKAQHDIAELASEMYDNGTDPKLRQQYINKINMILSQQQHWSIKDKAIEMMHILMLSGTRTHVRNILANMGMLPQEALARKISAIGQNAYHLVNPDYKPTQAFHVSKDAEKLAHEAFESKGGAEAIVEGLKGKYTNEEARKIGANYMFGTGKGNVFSKTNAKLKEAIPVLGDIQNNVGNAIEKKLKKIGSDGAYGAMDSDISALENYRQFIYGSLSSLEDNPFVKKNFEKRLASYIQAQGIKNLSEIPEEAFDIARAEAIKATFKDDNAVTELFKRIKKFPVLGEMLLPFVKTPANILVQSMDYSPIGVLRSIAGLVNKNSKFAKQTVGEGIDELAKGLGGSLTGALAMWLYANDVITGEKTGDADIDNYMANEGWQQYSLSTKGLADFLNDKLGTDFDFGDSYVDYSWLQPTSSDIIAAQGVYDELADGEKMSEKNIDEIFEKVKNTAGGYVDALLNQSTMQNISDVFSSDYDDQGVGKNIFDNVIEMPARFTSGAINDITKLTDDTKREYYSKNKPVETAVNMVQSKLPGASQKMPAKYDVFGNEMTRNTNRNEQIINTLANPASTTHRNKDDLYNYVDKLNEEAKGQYIPTKTPRSIELENGERLGLDNKQYSRLSKVSGDTRAEIINSLRSNKDFNKLDADTRAAILDEMENVIMAKGLKAVRSDAKLSKTKAEMLEAYNDNKKQFITDTVNKMLGKDIMKDSNISSSSNLAEEIKEDIANGNFEQAEQKVETAKSLQELGLTKPHVSDIYWSVHQQIPSLTQEEFAKKFKAMDTDGSQGIKQEEYLNFVNNHSLTEKQVKELWLYAKGTSPKIPVLEDGKWKLKK